MTVGLVATLVVAAAAVAAGAQTGEKRRATEVGITAKEFHIVVVADVESAPAPNLFRGSVDGVLGVAKYLNANGGIAGRKVVVDFYDSELNPNITRDALISVCQNDAVMVGTSAIFLGSVDEMRNCRDATGAAIGIPDIPFVTATVLHQCSDESFPIVPPVLICSTKDQRPQTYQSGIGRAVRFPAAAWEASPRRLHLQQWVEGDALTACSPASVRCGTRASSLMPTSISRSTRRRASSPTLCAR